MSWRAAYSRASRGGVAGAGSRVLGVDKTDCEEVGVDNTDCELLRGGMAAWVVCVVARMGLWAHEGVDMTKRQTLERIMTASSKKRYSCCNRRPD